MCFPACSTRPVPRQPCFLYLLIRPVDVGPICGGARVHTVNTCSPCLGGAGGRVQPLPHLINLSPISLQGPCPHLTPPSTSSPPPTPPPTLVLHVHTLESRRPRDEQQCSAQVKTFPSRRAQRGEGEGGVFTSARVGPLGPVASARSIPASAAAPSTELCGFRRHIGKATVIIYKPREV